MSTRPIACDDRAGIGVSLVAAHHTEDRRAPARRAVTHSYAALAFYTGGGARVEQRGEWTLQAGDALVIPAGEPHRMMERRRPEYWGLAISAPHLVAERAAPFERVRDGGAAVVTIPSARHEFLAELFRELEAAEHARRPGDDAAAAVQRSLLTLILHEVDRAVHASPNVAASTPASSVVTESLRFIERNCLRQLTLDEIAAAVRRSSSYVTSALTRATGRSAGAWITSGRMAEARRLLLSSDEMIDVIAERIGYADATHFIRMFRREHGASPAAWRAAQARRASTARPQRRARP